MIGGGVMGLATARALSRAGAAVTVFEQYELGHHYGSSHGRSRIIRKAYPDAFYTSVMQEAYPMWFELNDELGEEVAIETGLLYFGNPKHLIGVSNSTVVDRVLSPAEVSGYHSHLQIQPDEVACASRDAGWVRADRVVAGLERLGRAAGVEFVAARIQSLDELKSKFDQVVICAGSWVHQFVSFDHTTTLQTFAYIRLDRPMVGPVFIDGEGEMIYGFPSEPGSCTFKIGVHQPGKTISPDEPRRTPCKRHAELLKAFARYRMGVQEPEFESIHTCLYTNTPTEDFRWGRLDDRTSWVSPCSGHGFKFALWIGEQMAKMARGELDPASIPRFLT